jgi:Ca2+-binding RTX toxin-like protein
MPWITGSALSDTLSGGTTDDDLFGFAGHGLLSGGAGSDVLIGADGDDTLDGGGVDTLRFTGNQTLDLFAAGGNGQIVGIDVLNLDEGANSVWLGSQHVALMTDHLLLRIDGQSDDHFTSAGQGWSQLADTVLGAQVYHHDVAGGVELRVDADIAATVF